MIIPEKFADLLGHIPFLLVTYHDDQGKHKVGFNLTRILEILGAVFVIVYLLSKQVATVESKIDLISATAAIERAQTAAAIAAVGERVKVVEERLYDHNAKTARGGR